MRLRELGMTQVKEARRSLIFSTLLISLGLQLVSHAVRAQAPVRDEILWDSWGVPHIYASTRESAFYQLGWAQMHAHADLIARLYGSARGRGAAHWGEPAFEEDALVHTLRIPERADAWFAAQTPEYKRCLDAFTRGLNDYAAAHPDSVHSINRWVLPMRTTDVLSHVQRVLFGRFLFSDADAVMSFREQSPGPRRQRAAGSRGSNGYAIAPARSAAKESMLVINPHLPWAEEMTLFEAQLVRGDRYFYGAALVGQPYLSMGFSATSGWTHTVNGFDGLDTFELTLRDGGYLFDGKVRSFEASEPVALEVKMANGKKVTRAVPRLASVHGPVVAIDARRQKALALRFTAEQASDLVQRYWELAEADKAADFDAISNRHRLPYFNTLYANRRGEILFRYEGLMPKRKGGDFASWQGIQPGASSENLWTSYYGSEALPRLLNPLPGFLQNANDPPWFATYPQALDPAKFPPYIAPSRLDFRAQQSIKMVAADSSIEFGELVASKQSNRVELAERVLPDLLAAVREQRALAEPMRVLEAWDRTLSASARGAVLFLAWVDAMGGPEGDWFAEPWSAGDPLTTPRGIAKPADAQRALRAASARVHAKYGRVDVPYGDVYRLRLGKHDLPASTGPVAYGLYSAAEFVPARDGRQVAWGGDTFVAVVSFGAATHAQGLLTYGNSSQPSSSHLGDQLELFSQRALRPLWLTRAEVEQHLEAREQAGAVGGNTAFEPRSSLPGSK